MSAPTTDPAVDPPGRSLNASLKKCDALHALLAALADSHPDDPDRVAAAACRTAGCEFGPLRDSLVWALAAEDRARALRRVAGNRDALRAGRPVLETTPADTRGWGVVQFVRVDPAVRRDYKTRRTERVLRVRVKPLTGPACPDPFVQVFTPALLRYVARRKLGFTRTSGKRPLMDDHELSGLRALAWFVPGEGGRPRMHKYDLNTALRQWNVTLLTARQRRDPARFVCPLAVPLAVPCWQCAAGRDRCPAACRPRTLAERRCPGCGDPLWLDPTDPPDSKCLACQAKEL